MRQRPVLAALAAALLATGGVCNAAPATMPLDIGGPRAFVQPDAALALAGVDVFVRAGLDRQTGEQNGLAALVAESLLHVPVDGVPLADAITARGGSLTYAISAQYVRFYLEAQPGDLPTLAALVARAFTAHAFDVNTLAAARAGLAEKTSAIEGDPRQVGLGMLLAEYYRGGAGMPALGTASALTAFSPADATAFFSAWYLRGDAVITAVGQTGDPTTRACRTLAAALPAGSAPDAALATRPFTDQPRRLVTKRDVYAPYVVIGFAAPGLGDPDFPAALVMRTLLSDVLSRPAATTTPPVLRASGTIYSYDIAPAHLAVWINGARVDPSVGLSALDAVLKRAAAQPLTADVIGRFRTQARGEWALENLSLDERAWAIGDAVVHGLDANVANSIDDAIGTVTPADVQRVAKRYFQKFDVAVVLPREGSGG